VAVHGDRRTDFVAAACAAHLHDVRALPPAEGLSTALAAGLEVSPETASLLGVDYGEIAGLSLSR
jgi:hypothetical protein